MPEWKDLLAAVISLVASFAGAWAAFKLQNSVRGEEKTSLDVGAGNRALYTVFALWNVLEQYRKEVIGPVRDREDAWLNMAANPVSPSLPDRFKPESLQFLLERQRPALFADLILQDQRVVSAIGLIQARSEIVLKTVFPKMAAAGISVNEVTSSDKLQRILGDDICHQLTVLTATIIKNVDEDAAALRVAYNNLSTALVELYLGGKFLKISFENSD